MFAEEGGEAVHSAMTRAAQLCRAMKNPRARLLATKRHLEAKQRAKLAPHVKKSRVSKKQRLNSAAAAAGGGAAGSKICGWVGLWVSLLKYIKTFR